MNPILLAILSIGTVLAVVFLRERRRDKKTERLRADILATGMKATAELIHAKVAIDGRSTAQVEGEYKIAISESNATYSVRKSVRIPTQCVSDFRDGKLFDALVKRDDPRMIILDFDLKAQAIENGNIESTLLK